jgi:sugar O-acyltransferase (sialic acid O-acetyltransferase NeuD family)
MAGRMSSQTERALARVRHGESVAAAARIEDVDPSTLWRAIRRMKDKCDGAPGRFVIVGAGNFGREIRQWMLCDHRPEQIVFLDDTVTGPDVIGTIDSYQRQDGDEVIIAIADPREKQAAAERFVRISGYQFSDAVVGDAKIGDGCVICPGVIVSTNVRLGMACALNLQTSVGHDVTMGDYCQLSPHVGISGHVKIGNRCFFGSGAQVIPKVTIGDDCTIGAGAVVIRDVEPASTMVGNPARRIK